MEGGEYCDGGWQGWNGFRPGPRNLDASTLSAATYLGYTPLVKDLLRQAYDPTHGDYIFPSAMYVVARTGQADMLQVFQEHLPQFEPSSLPHNPSA